jgi:inner membrane protein
MNRSFIFKVVGIFLLTVLMSWAVSYVNGIILERKQRQVDVKSDIARSSAGEQTIVGPVLVVPYMEDFLETTTENNVKKVVAKSEQNFAFVLPENLEASGGFTNEYKQLGIYKALMYQLSGSVKGTFKIPANFNIHSTHNNGSIRLSPAYISLGISDPRGITTKPVFNWGNQTLPFAQGSRVKSLGNGIHVALGNLNTTSEQTIPFEFKLNLRGMDNFNIVPIAENNTIALNSNWQSPHFSGSFLPDAATQKIDANGFSAKWAVSSLSSSNQATMLANLSTGASQALETLSVGFVEPINVYSQSDRATKYGLLFIGLTFAGFFIFEILKRLRIHPAQYTFVGLAMALFYLLLVSLAERIGFAYAYLSASAACVGLLGYYLSFVLKSKANGMLFESLLTALYSALYGILASEDNALLMGSLLVFGLLALVMIITRKVDWYQISSKDVPQQHSAYDVV